MILNRSKSQADMTANPSKYPQGHFKEKPCRKCKVMFKPLAPSHLYCSDSCAKETLSNRYYKRMYGVTLDDVTDMHSEQGGVCGICGDKGFSMAKRYKNQIVVDHDHTTGKVRGLLCHNCNRGLGLFKDSVERLQKAVEYLNTRSY